MSARRLSTRTVTQQQAASYFRKAREFHETMNAEYGNGRWNSAALAGVHCAISAADAVLGKTAGIRSAGDSHADAGQLLRLHVRQEEAPRQAQRLLSILRDKNAVEYESREFTAAEAADMVKAVGRFWTWAQTFFL